MSAETQESHTMTDDVCMIENQAQTEDVECNERECQTDDRETNEMAVQVIQQNSEMQTQTDSKEAEDVVTQTDFGNSLNSVDCQTDEIVIKEQKELEATFISTYVQTVRSKPQQRTVGF